MDDKWPEDFSEEVKVKDHVAVEVGKLFSGYYLYKKMCEITANSENTNNVMQQLEDTQIVKNSYQGKPVWVFVNGNNYSVVVNKKHKEFGESLGRSIYLHLTKRMPPSEHPLPNYEVCVY